VGGDAGVEPRGSAGARGRRSDLTGAALVDGDIARSRFALAFK
jgi:hypothetical protein